MAATGTAATLVDARQAHEDEAWQDACAEFALADGRTPLAVDDLEAWAESAHILGRGPEAWGCWSAPTGCGRRPARWEARSGAPSGCTRH